MFCNSLFLFAKSKIIFLNTLIFVCKTLFSFAELYFFAYIFGIILTPYTKQYLKNAFDHSVRPSTKHIHCQSAVNGVSHNDREKRALSECTGRILAD